MRKRGRFTGAWLIVRFNWPLYAAALGAIAGAATVLALADGSLWKIAAFVVFAGAGWFLVGSLQASHIVYDRSDLHRGEWLARALPQPPRRLAICHCGYDEISALVREQMPDSSLSVLDHYDEAAMSEPSIHRARRLFPTPDSTVPAPHTSWPAADAEFAAFDSSRIFSTATRSANETGVPVA